MHQTSAAFFKTALCGISRVCHFVITWSVHVVTWPVQEYSFTVLWYYVVCAARVRIFHSECKKELAMASSEPSTSMLPE